MQSGKQKGKREKKERIKHGTEE